MTRSLRHGRQSVAIPGPSVIPDRVLSSMHRAMPNIYAGDLVDTSSSVLADLPAVARTSGEAFVTVSNGHGAWEMALTNTLRRGDRVLVLESGVFARSWGNMAETLGLEVQTLPADSPRHPVDPAAVARALAADTEHSIKAVLTVQVDTASSVLNDIEAIRSAIDAAQHPALFMVDCIASLGCEKYEMDAWGVDITVAASQKGLMVPPGLGFVWAGPKALAAYESADSKSAYLDWAPRREEGGAHYLKYCGTPPIQHIYALREALDMLNEEGLENVWWRHRVLAGAVRAAVGAWAAPGGLELAIHDPAARSNAVTTILTGAIDPDRLRALAENGAGLVLGVGLEGLGERAFRIGHMGHLNPAMLLGTLGTIEAVLLRMGAQIGGSGAAAAAASIAPHLEET